MSEIQEQVEKIFQKLLLTSGTILGILIWLAIIIYLGS